MTQDKGISRRDMLLGRIPRASPEPTTTGGIASIRTLHCLAWQGTPCTVCSEQCPEPGAIVLDRGRPTIVADRCTGCGTCRDVCPAPYNPVIVMPPSATEAITRPPEPPSPSAPTTSDWRAAYFEGRSLRPPGDE